MSEAPDNHALARQLAVLEERMNTRQAEYESALERIAGDHRDALGRLQTDMAKRDKSNIQWIAAMIFGASVLIIAVIGLMIRSGG